MKNILCISTYFKGSPVLTTLNKNGYNVYLVTSSELKNDPWPFQDIKETYYLNPNEDGSFNMEHLELGVAGIMREINFDSIMALDDFDVEKGAFLRERFRIGGMGATTGKYFRDKLAMRTKAQELGIRIPAFTAIFNNQKVHEFTQNHPAPWVLKPRAEASATGIKKIHSSEQLWQVLHELKDDRHRYLLEQFKPGDIYHIDCLTTKGDTVFCQPNKYLAPPLDVSHGGGIFRSITASPSELTDKMKDFTKEILQKFNINFGASHTELIHCHEDGEIYFLETAARVGGAHIAEMVEAATGVNLWSEWANIEYCRLENKEYQLPPVKNDFSGIVLSLSKMKRPHYNVFDVEECWWEIPMDYHIGAIFNSPSEQRIKDLLDQYGNIILEQFTNILPPDERILN